MRCPVCSSEGELVFLRRDQPGSVHMPEGRVADMAICGCRACDFFWNREAFLDPSGFDAWMAPAYKSYTLLDNDLHGFPLVDPRTLTAEGVLDAHLRWEELEHVLEVGSNRGDFLAYLRQRHPHLRLMGIESSPLSLVGVPTLFHDVREVRLSPSFDLVIARQVLEHMADPAGFLSHVASFVKEGGWLLVEVPTLENELGEGVDPWVMEHVGHFSERALEILGHRAGLSRVASDNSYQLSALFRKQQPQALAPAAADNVRWSHVERFLAGVDNAADHWRAWAEQGGALCFYGASNVFLAITAELRQRWGEDFWSRCRLELADDSPGRRGTPVGGLLPGPLERTGAQGRTLYVVCAMYRYHRQKMIPKVQARLRPGDELWAMWTPLVR